MLLMSNHFFYYMYHIDYDVDCLSRKYFACFRFKNVLFEITATETQGLFDVSAKLMGVNMEKVELVFQVRI